MRKFSGSYNFLRWKLAVEDKVLVAGWGFVEMEGEDACYNCKNHHFDCIQQQNFLRSGNKVNKKRKREKGPGYYELMLSEARKKRKQVKWRNQTQWHYIYVLVYPKSNQASTFSTRRNYPHNGADYEKDLKH